MLNALGIKEIEKKQYIQLSTGQKRRLHLALALIGNPDVIFLDEPTAGLDVEGRLSLHEQIRNLKHIGKTIVLASHDMAEVETLCDRIAILNNGNIDTNKYLAFEEESDIARLPYEYKDRFTYNDELPIVDGAAAFFPMYSSFVDLVSQY